MPEHQGFRLNAAGMVATGGGVVIVDVFSCAKACTAPCSLLEAGFWVQAPWASLYTSLEHVRAAPARAPRVRATGRNIAV